MSFLDRFRKGRQSREIANSQEVHKMLTDSLEEIIRRVTAQSGIDRWIRFEDDDLSVAFSGTKEDPALRLNLDSRRSGGIDYLIAGLDDGLHWYEWEFEDRFAFLDTVVNYIAIRMNHRIKCVTEMERHKGVRRKEYIMDEQGQWQLISDDRVDNWSLRLFVTQTSTSELEWEYHI